MKSRLPSMSSSGRQRVDDFKLGLTSRLCELMGHDDREDGPAAVAALAELTVQLSHTTFGQRLTLELLQELARQVRGMADEK